MGYTSVGCAKEPLTNDQNSIVQRNCYLARELLCICCVRLPWLFIPFYRSLPLRMRVNASLYDCGSVDNEWWGVIEFNDLLPVGSSVSLLLVWHVNHYSCHLWGTHLMFVVVIHYFDDSGFSLLHLLHGRGWFFSYSVAPLFQSSYLYTQLQYERSNCFNFYVRHIYCEGCFMSHLDTCPFVIA